MAEKESKNYRTLDMYVRFCEGKYINKSDEAARFGVDERSIQRDIDDIRAFLSERQIQNGNDVRDIKYDRVKKGFYMSGEEGSMMTNSEILAVSEILLASRAFSKKEIQVILDKLIEGCVPVCNMKLVSDLIANERFHYVENHHKEYIKDKLWQIGADIQEHNLIKMQYEKTSGEMETYVIEPLSMMFSEYYFYLNAYVVIKDEVGKYVHKYNYPAIFRIDRICEYKKLEEKFRVNYATRFEEGEFRKKIQFMYAGQLTKFQIKYYGLQPEAILDRIPTAKIVERCEDYAIIEAELYGKGCLMWLLSQGEWVEVIKPESMRTEMKERLERMLERYQESK